ncbi:FISUMP domain-containing protein [uncultured Flavonifractor sp.]|uniref:FISUMP domain-containing protein n=1 Tax=uncultured Flavonifractor sp. TaxID=1193534 RepID=UPI00262C7071|nr:FISUMP domain-containing protein [uncultured Flavonifractor sp.]
MPSKAETDTTSGTDNGYSISVTASNTSLDTHNFTIRYFNPNRTETASVSNTQITNTNMSSFTGVDCGSLSVGDIVSLTDERNGQTYRIKKMQDEKCWMVDNLKYAGEANTDLANVDGTYGLVYNNESGKYNTVDGTNTQSTTNSDKAFYNNPMSASYCYGTSIQSSYTKCGYLYNWYAATAGTGTYATSTWDTNVSGSICPTGWRLPSATSDGSTATGNGTSDTAADLPVLNASMNAGSLTTGSTSSSYYAGWQFTGAWSGVFSGYWFNGFLSQGSLGYYWSSTVYSSTNARNLSFYSSSVSPGNNNVYKYRGFAIRCVMDGVNLADDLPETINPDNYTSSNPAVVDVYPTTGWTGDVIAITSNAQFNNVTDVTIGGTSCSPYQVISDSLIACKLPSKSANASDGYAVAVTTSSGSVSMNNATIRYFSPSRTETIGSSTTSNITMQNFTQSNCNAMTVGQVVSLTDSRNNQTYRIKKMQDNKCWMVDNLKYAGEANTDLANVDSTTGITYNNTDGKYNTVDGTYAQSTANSDKAFYNNPMSASYCYGTSIQSSYTKCGYLYNWYAATAGTGTYTTSTYGTNVSGSICPTGWRLPSGSSDGSTATGDGTS